MDDILINYGGELKAVQSAPDTLDFKARLVTFGDPADPLSGHDSSPLMDLFSVKTDFDIEDGDKTTLYYHHGLDPELKRRKLGSATLCIKDDGVWMEGQLKARDAYEKRIQEMIRAGKLGVSSGVPAHLVERHDIKTERGTVHHVDLWPLGKDASFTPTPAEARCGVYALKSLFDGEGDEIKFDARQPRDDHGKWTDSAGKLSAGHAVAVMKHEGITDEKHHAAVREAIESGKHKTREDVLKHIDSIHAAGKMPKESHEMTLDEFVRSGGDKELHEIRVRAAIHQGAAIPDNVAKEYPHLLIKRDVPLQGSDSQIKWANNIREGFVKWWNDPNTQKYLQEESPRAVEQAKPFVEKMLTENHAGYWINNHKNGDYWGAVKNYARANQAGKSFDLSDYDEFFDESTKNLDQLAADSQGSLRFLDHSARLHDAVTEWTDRFADWADGFDAVKSGRTLTRDKQTHLSTVADCLHESAATMRAFLDAHAAEPEPDNVPDNAPDANATKSIDATKSIEHGWQSYVERELAQSGLTL